jgi:hypothetical protein
MFLIVSCNKKEDSTKPITYIRVSDGNSWGFTDNKGKSIIPFGKYVFLNPMDEKGMIFAQKGNKYGYIDINQKVIIPFEYDELSLFSNDLASAKKNGKFGFINRKGLVVIPFQFEEESSFRDNSLALVKKNNRYGFINKSGKVIIPIIYQEVKETTSDSLVVVSKNGKWAFFSNKGKQKSNFIYDEIIFSKIGLIYVKKDRQIGYLDFNLKEIIPFGKYTYGENFNQNKLAIVSKNNRFGVINEFGKEVIKIEYDTLEHPGKDYTESNTFAARKNNYFILFDEKGKKVADKIKEYSFDRITIQNKNKGAYQIQNLSGQFGVIGDNGEVLIPIIYDDINKFRGDSVTVVKSNNKSGLIKSNNEIVYPINNDWILRDRDLDFYIIKKNNKAGIINKNLLPVLGFNYQEITPCHYNPKNLFIAKKNDKFGVIGLRGNIIIPFEYDELSNWVEYGPGSKYHFVTKNKKKGLITKEGKIIIPTIYDNLFYKDDKTIVLSKNKKYGVVTIQYQPVIPFIYDAIYVEFSDSNKTNNEFYVSKEEKYFVLNNENKVIRANVSEKEIKERFYFELKFLKK